jgi:nucleotide-binding universal stress UspA family protein
MDFISSSGQAAARMAPGFLPQRSTSARDAAASPARRIVAFVDDTSSALNAAWRAALVARDRSLPLHLVTLQPLHANLADARARVEALAQEVRSISNAPISSHAVAGTIDHEGVDIAREAALVVVPAPTGRRRWWPGSPELRMLRRSGRPVLAVRMPATGSYRSVVAAVERDLASNSLVAAAHALSRDTRMKVLHALDTRHEESLRLADVPESTIRMLREREAARSRSALADMIAAAGAHAAAEPVIVFGGAGSAVIDIDRAADAQLIVVGKRTRRPWLDALLGSVAHSVLRHAAADVLLVPLDESGAVQGKRLQGPASSAPASHVEIWT